MKHTGGVLELLWITTHPSTFTLVQLVFSTGQSVSPKGGPDRTVVDDIVSPPGLFPNVPCHPPPRTRSPTVPLGKCFILAVPAVTCSPAVPLLSLVYKSPEITHLFHIIFYTFSSSALVLCLLQHCFLCFWCSSLRFSFLYCNSVRTDRTGDGIAIWGYHRC